MSKQNKMGCTFLGVLVLSSGIFMGFSISNKGISAPGNVNLAGWRGAPSDEVALLTHVGISTYKIDECIEFYGKYLGLKEAFRTNNPDGSVRSVYLHCSPNTFIELFRAKKPLQGEHPLHIALMVRDMKAAVEKIKKRGMPEQYIRNKAPVQGKFDHSWFFNFKDPEGNRVELMQYNEDSLQYKAIMKRIDTLAQ